MFKIARAISWISLAGLTAFLFGGLIGGPFFYVYLLYVAVVCVHLWTLCTRRYAIAFRLAAAEDCFGIFLIFGRLIGFAGENELEPLFSRKVSLLISAISFLILSTAALVSVRAAKQFPHSESDHD